MTRKQRINKIRSARSLPKQAVTLSRYMNRKKDAESLLKMWAKVR